MHHTIRRIAAVMLAVIACVITSCIAYNRDGAIAFGTDAKTIDHRFGESFSATVLNNSKSMAMAKDLGLDISRGIVIGKTLDHLSSVNATDKAAETTMQADKLKAANEAAAIQANKEAAMQAAALEAEAAAAAVP